MTKSTERKKHILLQALALILCAALIMPLSSCGSMKKYTRTDMTLFDTETVIVGYDCTRGEFEEKADVIIEKLKKYHRLYDIYHEYSGMSNLKTVNDNAGSREVSIESEVIDLIEFGREMYALTGGKMNIAMGSVTKIWHEYREEGKAVPPMELLREAAQHTDISCVVCNREAGTVTFSDPLVSLDVGAVAKGYATEAVARLIAEKGWSNIALSVGGNIRTIGKKGDGKPWVTGIENPIEDAPEAVAEKVELWDSSAVTSGSYQRYYEVDGVRYHHIIDPETLMPENRFLSVTVLYEDSGVADALSTALFNMPEEDGRQILEKVGARGLWIYPDGDKSMTDNFLSADE